jgi:hypothetical protein
MDEDEEENMNLAVSSTGIAPLCQECGRQLPTSQKEREALRWWFRLADLLGVDDDYACGLCQWRYGS